MISSKNLAEAIYEISTTSKNDPDILSSAILDYVKSYRLESLLPKAIMYIEDKIKKQHIWKTFYIESKFDLSNEILNKIKNKLNANQPKYVVTQKNDEIIGGFVATYQGMIYDASIKNQLQLLKKILTK